MSVDKKNFFGCVRRKFGALSQSQVEGFDFLLDRFSEQDLLIQEVAYMLATVWHETATTMQPITEYGGRKYFDKYDTGRLAKVLGNTPQKDGDGFKYRGRGYAMITGAYNYRKFAVRLGIPLDENPDLALDPEIAFKILLQGCVYGLFTGKKLSDYIDAKSHNYRNARTVVNGFDEADLIASYARTFEKCLLASN